MNGISGESLSIAADAHFGLEPHQCTVEKDRILQTNDLQSLERPKFNKDIDSNIS